MPDRPPGPVAATSDNPIAVVQVITFHGPDAQAKLRIEGPTRASERAGAQRPPSLDPRPTRHHRLRPRNRPRKKGALSGYGPAEDNRLALSSPQRQMLSSSAITPVKLGVTATGVTESGLKGTITHLAYRAGWSRARNTRQVDHRVHELRTSGTQRVHKRFVHGQQSQSVTNKSDPLVRAAFERFRRRKNGLDSPSQGGPTGATRESASWGRASPELVKLPRRALGRARSYRQLVLTPRSSRSVGVSRQRVNSLNQDGRSHPVLARLNRVSAPPKWWARERCEEDCRMT